MDFFLHSFNDGGDVVLDFSRSLHAWIFVLVIYIYQCYLVWGVINILMYSQIVEEDERRKQLEKEKLQASNNCAKNGAKDIT